MQLERHWWEKDMHSAEDIRYYILYWVEDSGKEKEGTTQTKMDGHDSR